MILDTWSAGLYFASVQATCGSWGQNVLSCSPLHKAVVVVAVVVVVVVVQASLFSHMFGQNS